MTPGTSSPGTSSPGTSSRGTSTALDPDDVAERLREVRRRIAAAGGDHDGIRIVAVTKGFGPDAVRAARAAGLSDLGENYADELVSKHPASEHPASEHPASEHLASEHPASELGDRTEPVAGAGEPAGREHETGHSSWHFLGRVQRNKVKRLAPLVSVWQAVDRVAAGQEIARRAPGARVLVQLDFTGVEGRNGCAPGEAEGLVGELREMDLDVAGLMAVGPLSDPDAARDGFRKLASLADRLSLPERSMGMSDDLEIAVEEGSTMVRVGRALFGPRTEPTERPR